MVEVKLTEAERAALTAMLNCHSYCPERARRPFFHTLIDRGFARWTGYGLGGEGFAITPAGRAATTQPEAHDHG